MIEIEEKQEEGEGGCGLVAERGVWWLFWEGTGSSGCRSGGRRSWGRFGCGAYERRAVGRRWESGQRTAKTVRGRCWEKERISDGGGQCTSDWRGKREEQVSVGVAGRLPLLV